MDLPVSLDPSRIVLYNIPQAYERYNVMKLNKAVKMKALKLLAEILVPTGR